MTASTAIADPASTSTRFASDHQYARPRKRVLAGDPRHFQIAALTGLLVYGMAWLGFELTLTQVLITVAGTVGTQWLCMRAAENPSFDMRSALISALSLCLLLRVDGLHFAALAAVLAIGSKFALRYRGHHLFNPTGFAIAALLVCSDRVWVSTGQWGHTAFVSLAVAGLGLMVLTRARRLDTALTFALAWSVLILLRVWWLNDPLSIAWHQLNNGTVMLFCLFMITDPRTTPDTRQARVVFALAVAVLGAALNFGLYRSDGLIIALALCGPLNLLLNASMGRAAQQRTGSHRTIPN
jgi:Na+-transporting NADH:ubiquinone oxidoreductase subunit NqrB